MTATHDQHQRYLSELTALPTAAGREDRVVAWVRQWARRHRNITLRRDRFGNIMLARAGARSRRPIIFAAHMDHPAFVVTRVEGRDVFAEFRGGVHGSYFHNAAVRLHPASGGHSAAGHILCHQRPGSDTKSEFVQAHARFDTAPDAQPGDVMSWDLPAPAASGDRFTAPACDDLAAVAAALAALEQHARKSTQGRLPDVRVLLTRAEEIGFIGALAACRSRLIPKEARIVALENSKSFAESPIGGGPIARVGDRTSTFDPELTHRIGKVAEQMQDEDEAFQWQRRLMPGGTCEASAYQAMGYSATCICLPLGNYHNMNEQAERIDSEVISLADYHAMIRWLVGIGRWLDDPRRTVPLKQRLDELFIRRQHVLEEGES